LACALFLKKVIQPFQVVAFLLGNGAARKPANGGVGAQIWRGGAEGIRSPFRARYLPEVPRQTPMFACHAPCEHGRPQLSQEGSTTRVLRTLTGKPGPASGLDCLIYDIFARQRTCHAPLKQGTHTCEAHFRRR